jgi:hypothetical protein
VKNLGNEKNYDYPVEPKIVVKDPPVRRTNKNCHAGDLLDRSKIGNFKLPMSPEPILTSPKDYVGLPNVGSKTP